MKRIVLTADPILAPFNPSEISQSEFDRSQQLIRWHPERNGTWRISRAKPHVVGRLICNQHLFVVAPEIDTRLFVGLVLYANGLKPFSFDDFAGAVVSARDEHDAFLIVLAGLMIQAAEELLSKGANKLYEVETQLSQTIRGRVKWLASSSRPPQQGLVCEFYQMQLDNELNRLVLAGIGAAAIISPTAAASRQLFAWRGICKRVSPSQARFDRALATLNRRTSSYRQALTLAKLLLYGVAVDDLFFAGSGDMPEMQFNLATMFEYFIGRLLKERFAGTPVMVTEQNKDRGAIVAINRSTYQSIRPDIRLESHGRSLAVFDAKFKPRYVSGERVTEQDLYQVHFYITRASNPGEVLVCAGILAPRVDESGVSPINQRHIVFPDGNSGGLHLKIIPVEIPAILRALGEGRSAREALATSPEFDLICQSVEMQANFRAAVGQ